MLLSERDKKKLPLISVICTFFGANVALTFWLTSEREKEKKRRRAIQSEGVWNGFLLVSLKVCDIRCRFCDVPDGDGHLFWECPFPPWSTGVRTNEFFNLMNQDRSRWSRCLYWHSKSLISSPLGICPMVIWTEHLGACPGRPSAPWCPDWAPVLNSMVGARVSSLFWPQHVVRQQRCCTTP